MRPIIGISGNYHLSERYVYIQDYYVRSLQRAGGVAVVLPPVQEEQTARAYIGFCQGVLLSGGGDLDPVHWGETPEPGLGEINPLRDQFELGLARLAMARNLPILGICRGCQVMNVAAGGSLIQDICSTMQHNQNAPRDYAFHSILIEKDSLLKKVLNSREIRVNSFHHQAVGRPGNGFKVCARAADGIVEAIESTRHSWVIGVQWHPECLKDDSSGRLFEGLIEATRNQARRTPHP